MKTRALLLLFILIFTGCGVYKTSYPNVVVPKSIEFKDKKTKLLIQRFQQYWFYRTHGDYNKSWLYELPHYRFKEFLENYKVMAGSYANTKIVLKKITYMHPNVAIIERDVVFEDNTTVSKKDKWIYIKDNWYHKFYQAIFPPQSNKEAIFQ